MKKLCTLILIALYLSLQINAEEKSNANAEAKLQIITNKISQNKSKIKVKKKKKKRIENEIYVISRELRYTELSLRRVKTKYAKSKKAISRTQQNLIKAQNKFSKKNDKFVKRLVSIYKNKDFSTADFLFSNKDFSPMDAMYFFNRIIETDLSLIKGTKNEYKALKKEKNKLKKQLYNLGGLKTKIKEQELSLSAKKSKKKRYLRNISSEIAKIEARNNELLRSSKHISKDINKITNNVFYGTGRFIKPTLGWLSSKFGYRKHPLFKRRLFHSGIDLAAPKGYKIKASDSGKVILAGRAAKYRGYGKITIIDHGRRPKDGKRISTVYAHQSRTLVKKGAMVKRGQIIGLVGSTGYSTGPHLHFEIRENGRPINPLKYIRL
jgi:murein DD-endopeptidase MepM/ murein hydrolase activator NlpD